MVKDKGTGNHMQVRGISLLSTRRYMKTHFTQTQWQEFLDQVSPSTRDSILTIKKGGKLVSVHHSTRHA